MNNENQHRLTLPILAGFACIALLFTAPLVVAEEAYNLKAEVHDSYKTVAPGKAVWFTSKVFNLGAAQRADVILKYEIVDAKGQVRASKTETVAVQTQASFVGSLDVPKELAEGAYSLRVTLTSPQSRKEAEAAFNVKKESQTADDPLWILGGVAALAILSYLAFPFLKQRMHRRELRSKIRGIVQKRLKQV